MTAVMGVVDVHFAALQRTFSSATLLKLPDGSAVVSVPEVPLGPAWSKPSTTVMFQVPAAYPSAQLDCFWADADLALVNGQTVEASNVAVTPWGTPGRWFSYHVSSWLPSSDTISTYFRALLPRLADGR